MTDLETAQTPDAESAESPASRLVDLLAEEGYRPHLLEPEGRYRFIDFKAEGSRFQIRWSDADPDFLGIVLGYLLDQPAAEEGTLLRAGADVQTEAKVVKFFLDPGCKYYEMHAEVFLGGRPLNARQLERCIQALRHAARAFYERLQTEAPKAKA